MSLAHKSRNAKSHPPSELASRLENVLGAASFEVEGSTGEEIADKEEDGSTDEGYGEHGTEEGEA